MKFYKFIIIALCAFFIAGCSNTANNPSSRTPTETLKALGEAGKKKDVAETKKFLSKGSLEMLEKLAKAQNQNLDQFLAREDSVRFQNISEYGAEKIQSETATVEVKNYLSDEFELIPLVREEGEWKTALDKYTEDYIKHLNEQMTIPVSNSNIAPTNSNGNQANIKPNTNQNSMANNEELKSIQNRLKNK